MGFQSVIIVRNQGTDLSDDYIQKVLDKYKSTSSFTSVDGEELSSIFENNSTDLKGVKDVSNAYQDHNLILQFGNTTEDLSEDNQQPYVLVTDKDSKPVIMAYMEGEFPQFVKTDSSNLPQIFVCGEELEELCQDLYDKNDGDLDKTMKAIEAKSDRIRRLMMPKGAIVMMAKDGTVLTFSTGCDTLTTKWGWASDACGYKEFPEQQQKADEKVVDKALSKMEQMRLNRAQRLNKETPKKEDKDESKVEAVAVVDMVGPDATMTTAKQLRQWYNIHRKSGWQGDANLGIKELDPLKRPQIPVTELKSSSPLRPQIKDFKDLKPAIAENVPVLSNKAIERLAEFLKTIKSETPDDFRAKEDDWPTFTQQLPKELHITLRDVVYWPKKKKQELIRVHTQAADALIDELCYALLDAWDVKTSKLEKQQQKAI